jgi:hypothetical protein
MTTVQLDGCRVRFPDWYDDRGEWEAEEKGWLQGVEVELPDGRCFPLFLYDPVRLAQALEHTPTAVAEPGLVVLPEVTRSGILRSVPELVRRRYFDHLVPTHRVGRNGVAVA